MISRKEELTGDVAYAFDLQVRILIRVNHYTVALVCLVSGAGLMLARATFGVQWDGTS